jgi:hypothetical protein
VNRSKNSGRSRGNPIQPAITGMVDVNPARLLRRRADDRRSTTVGVCWTLAHDFTIQAVLAARIVCKPLISGPVTSRTHAVSRALKDLPLIVFT